MGNFSTFMYGFSVALKVAFQRELGITDITCEQHFFLFSDKIDQRSKKMREDIYMEENCSVLALFFLHFRR